MATKKYTNGAITILWQPKKCIHSGICVKMLPQVYNPRQRPWIKMENATTPELIAQVAKCPSGALSIEQNKPTKVTIEREDDGKKGRFALYEDGDFAGEMTFTWAGETKFIIDHTGVEEQYGGKGYAKQLVMAGVDYARKNNVKIIPLCPYAKSRFDKDESIRDVLV